MRDSGKKVSLPPKPLEIGPLLVDPPVLQAPMAGFTNYAFRQIVRRFGGAGLLATEMVSARGLLQIDTRGGRLPERLWEVENEPRPLAVQIWDNDPQVLAAIGRRLVERLRVSVVDINFGCPKSQVSQKAQSGSYLLRRPERVGAIVARVVEACAPVPVTAKIRLGWTRQTINAVEVARAVEEAGGAAVTVHGRTAAEKFGGSADWRRIAEIKPHLRRIPLIGNGDLTTPQSVVEAFCRWGVDGVMIGRAALCRPWLFRQAQAALADQPVPPDPTLAEQRQLLLDHYRLVVEQFGPEKGTVLMRRFACRYAHGSSGARSFRSHVSRVSTPGEFFEVVGRFFPPDTGV
jgi:tRNA-dihydrouridine synthase B